MSAQTTEILRQLRLGDYVVAEFVAGFTDAQLNWQPNQGKSWSIAQCIDHIAISHEQYLSAMLPEIERAKPSDGGDFAPNLFARSFIRNLAPPPRIKFPAPRKIQPASSVPGVEVGERFRKSHARLREALNALQGKDPNAITFRNPLMPLLRVKAGTGLLIATAHERRHLWQAKNVSELVPKQP